MSKTTVTGDDGIERTREEWYKFVCLKLADAQNSNTTSDNLINLRVNFKDAVKAYETYCGSDSFREMLKSKLENEKPEDFYADVAEEAGDAAKQFVVEALKQGRHLESEMIKLAKSLGSKGRTNKRNVTLGIFLFWYLLDNDLSFPISRTELRMRLKKSGGKAHEMFKTSKELSDSLAFYQLQGVCRDNHKG